MNDQETEILYVEFTFLLNGERFRTKPLKAEIPKCNTLALKMVAIRQNYVGATHVVFRLRDGQFLIIPDMNQVHYLIYKVSVADFNASWEGIEQ